MNLNIKKAYYVLLIVIIVTLSGYYVYTSQSFENIDNREAGNKDLGEKRSDDDEVKEGNNVPNKRDKIVYQVSVDNKDECTTFEKYNSNDKTCYYECNDEKECADIKNKINKELDSWLGDDIESDKNNKSGKDKNPVKENDTGITDDNTMASFYVLQGEQIKPKASTKELQKESQSSKEPKSKMGNYLTIWNKIAALSPDDLSDKYIEEFDVYNNDKDDSIAFVDDQDNNGKWRVAINESMYKNESPKEQYITLIHELSHIISLNESQMTRGTKCNTLQVEEGCLRGDSYLYKFYNSFYNKIWNQSENNIQKYKEENEDKFNNTFITEYAATNVVEDFAESFAYFVIKDDARYAVPIGIEKSLSEKNKKIAFMYHYFLPNDTLVSIREQMRAAISRELLEK